MIFISFLKADVSIYRLKITFNYRYAMKHLFEVRVKRYIWSDYLS